MSVKKLLVLVGTLILAAVIFAACSGAPTEAPEVPTMTEAPVMTETPEAAPVAASMQEVSVQPETCGICHPGAGDKHQASYDELYQDGVIKVEGVTYKFTEPGTTVVAFKMTKNGAPISGGSVQNLNIYFAPYADGKFQFDPAAERLSLKGKLSYDPANGVTTSTLEELDPTADGYIDYTNVSGVDGIVVVYGYDKQVGSLPARVKQVQFPYAGVLETGKGVDYVSPANNDGCEKCHSDPYLKHGNIYGQINGDPGTDFYACKVCHLDNGEGGHLNWQMNVENPEEAAAYMEGGEVASPEQAAQYAYKTTLMNDVHMSHAMEFPYPQSMSNCVTCHEGKLDVVLSDANFNVATCKSCHPVNGTVGPTPEGADAPTYDTTTFALKTILPEGHDLASDCTSCHGEGKVAPAFNQIHTGYDKAIYTADGVRYSDVITVSVDSASFADNKLTIALSAASSEDLGLDVANISPSVMVGLYGWDTKDYIVGPHERLNDDNGDGTIDSKDQRALEYVVGEEHPRFTTGSAAGGKWEVTADLSNWADMIADGTVKRVEIAVMPALENADGLMLALNAPSRTFDLGKNDFDDKFYSPIVKVVDGCNDCHDALGTTFHSPDRGGNVVVCRMCHITKSGGSHLEMQSRSIDSYVHAIHMSQQFDVGDIDFADPVQAEKYMTEIEMPFPKHGATDCEACHVSGAYNVPDQSKSLPGLLSASDTLTGRERNIGDVPSYVTGPATRACGGCHRAAAINEDSAGELAMLFRHWTDGGYMVEAGEDAGGTLQSVIDQIMTLFK